MKKKTIIKITTTAAVLAGLIIFGDHEVLASSLFKSVTKIPGEYVKWHKQGVKFTKDLVKVTIWVATKFKR